MKPNPRLELSVAYRVKVHTMHRKIIPATLIAIFALNTNLTSAEDTKGTPVMKVCVQTTDGRTWSPDTRLLTGTKLVVNVEMLTGGYVGIYTHEGREMVPVAPMTNNGSMSGAFLDTGRTIEIGGYGDPMLVTNTGLPQGWDLLWSNGYLSTEERVEVLEDLKKGEATGTLYREGNCTVLMADGGDASATLVMANTAM